MRAILVLFGLLLSHISMAQGYVTLAWVPPDNAVDPMYIVRYGTDSGVYTFSWDAGTSTTATISNLTWWVTYYFVVHVVSNGQESPASSETTFMPNPKTNPPVWILIQAESAKLESPFVKMEGETALEGGFTVTTNTDMGTCKFVVAVPFFDQFYVWARVFSPNEGQDSFYVSHSNKSDIYDTVASRTNAWQWTPVSGRGGLDKPFELARAIYPRVFLMSGTNEVVFGGRETWTGLDAIYVTNEENRGPKVPPAPLDLILTVEGR